MVTPAAHREAAEYLQWTYEMNKRRACRVLEVNRTTIRYQATRPTYEVLLNALIGNADTHLKNWSLLYADGITPSLSPAYDFVSTLAYIPYDKAALSSRAPPAGTGLLKTNSPTWRQRLAYRNGW